MLVGKSSDPLVCLLGNSSDPFLCLWAYFLILVCCFGPCVWSQACRRRRACCRRRACRRRRVALFLLFCRLPFFNAPRSLSSMFLFVIQSCCCTVLTHSAETCGPPSFCSHVPVCHPVVLLQLQDGAASVQDSWCVCCVQSCSCSVQFACDGRERPIALRETARSP